MFFSIVATQDAHVIPLIETINFTIDSISSSSEVVRLGVLCFFDDVELTDDDLFKSENEIREEQIVMKNEMIYAVHIINKIITHLKDYFKSTSDHVHT